MYFSMMLFQTYLNLHRFFVSVVMMACMVACGKEDTPSPTPDVPDVPEVPVPQEPDPVSARAAWPELPLCPEKTDWHYVTHYCMVKNVTEGREVKGRNYTMCFDATKRGAWWVAYPLHQVHLGKGRPDPDPWSFDPELSSTWQADLARGSYNGAYDRGHQIPNADRNADLTPGGMCYQTFYASNATPQASKLNQGEWGELEKKVRSWVCSDTLYVVTGAYWNPDSSKKTTDKSGNSCPIPDYYFKVVVRTTAGNVRQQGDLLGDYKADQLKAIGFLVANADGQGKAKDWVKSIAEIEHFTGFTFFPSLPEAVKQQKNAAAWGL